MMAFQSFVEGVRIWVKMWRAKERLSKERARSSRSLEREGQMGNWNWPLVMRWAWSCLMWERDVHFGNKESTQVAILHPSS